jgi:hypothetical protein
MTFDRARNIWPAACVIGALALALATGCASDDPSQSRKPAKRSGKNQAVFVDNEGNVVSPPTVTPGPTNAPKRPGRGPRTESAVEPCSEGLHSLCEPLLMYYLLHKNQFPDSIDDIKAITGPDPKYSYVCPVSGKPYVYNAAGLTWPDQPGRVVLYDPEPSHNGNRNAILVQPGAPGEPLITRVVSLPESRFAPNARP